MVMSLPSRKSARSFAPSPGPWSDDTAPSAIGGNASSTSP